MSRGLLFCPSSMRGTCTWTQNLSRDLYNGAQDDLSRPWLHTRGIAGPLADCTDNSCPSFPPLPLCTLLLLLFFRKCNLFATKIALSFLSDTRLLWSFSSTYPTFWHALHLLSKYILQRTRAFSFIAFPTGPELISYPVQLLQPQRPAGFQRC